MESKWGRWLVAIGSAILFFPFLGRVHLFDWDELNFAEIAREMIVSGDYLNVQIAFQPFYEKPPLFFWLQVLSMKLWGINELAARFPNAVVGVVALVLLYGWGQRDRGELFARWWVIAYAGSILPFIYFKSGIIDPLFNLLIFSAVWIYFRCRLIRDDANGTRPDRDAGRNQRPVLGAFARMGGLIGLAILTKGPVALLVFGLVAATDLLASKGRSWVGLKPWFVFFAFLISVGGSWFLLQIARGDWNVVVEFVRVQDNLFSKGVAGHAQPWFYHPLVLLIGCFPASIFALRPLFRRYALTDSAYGMLILFWVVLILFSIVKTKIVHYSSLTYYPLTYLAARELSRGQARRGVGFGLMGIGSIWVALFTAIPVLLGPKKDWLMAQLMDLQSRAMLNQPLEFPPVAFLVGPGFALVLIFAAVSYGRTKQVRRWWILFAGTTVATFLFLLTMVPQVERVTQGGAIEMYQSFRDSEVVLQTGYFKSYGYLFYSDADSIGHRTPTLERPHFTVAKVNRAARMESDSVFTPIRENGGYQLYYRQLYYWKP